MKIRFCLGLLGFFGLVACAVSPSVSSSPTVLMPVTATIIQPTKTQAERVTPVMTKASPATTIATPTTDELLDTMDVLREQSGCALPCWNGLTPGVSSADEVALFFARLGIDVSTLEVDNPTTGVYRLDAPISNYPTLPNKYPPRVEVVWKDDVVIRIELLWFHYSELVYPNRVSTKLGLPKSIELRDGPANSTVLLNYQDVQTAILFTGDSHDVEIDSNTLQGVCFPKSTFVDVVLYAPGATDAVRAMYGDWDDWAYILDLSVEELFGLMQTPETCIPSE